MNNYDIGIIGAGVAGACATYKIAKEYKNAKVVLFDLGRPPMKRRRQLEGWLGVLPNSDGKIYLNDTDKISNLIGTKKAKSGTKWFNTLVSNVSDFKTIKDKSPSINSLKRIKKSGYDVSLNNHVQLFPKEIHALSKFMADGIESFRNVTFSFDNEVLGITKQKNMFTIVTQGEEFRCKKILIAVGRSGWRWATELYSKFGIIESDDIARFGVRVEMPANCIKEFNKSNCTLYRGDELEVGPFSWNGTVIPEDHVDLAISAFRSNENRWKTDKVSFSFIGNKLITSLLDSKKPGSEQTNRIGQLAFVLANDRIIKEKVSAILTGKSKISIIPEYDWIGGELEKLAQVIPDLLTKAYFHVPTIMPLVPNINIGDNLETEIDGMFVAGESAGISGILSAGAMGAIAADAMCK